MTNHTDTSRSGDLVETLLCVDRGGVLHSRRPKQTHPVCAKAADRIEALEADKARLMALLQLAISALTEAREALHFHYVEWDGEPEDAVPLQLARAKCDQAISVLKENTNG